MIIDGIESKISNGQKSQITRIRRFQGKPTDWNRTAQPLRELSEVDRLRLRNQELERENLRLRNYLLEHPPAPPKPTQQAPSQHGFDNISKAKDELKQVNKNDL